MSAGASLRLRAFVGPTEAPAVEEAARQLTQSLQGQAVGVEFVASLSELREDTGPAVAIASLLPEVEAAVQDWPAAEARLTSAYQALAQGAAPTLFVCTVLRHAPSDLDEDATSALRLAIRRLDLLAVELSHATGLNIIDLDRALAHIGALELRTDYRLTGAAAAEAAGGVISATVLAAGLDDWMAPEGIGGA